MCLEVRHSQRVRRAFLEAVPRLDQFQDESLDAFVDALCDVFVKYHRDRSIVPRPKQRLLFAEDHRGGRVSISRKSARTDAAREKELQLETSASVASRRDAVDVAARESPRLVRERRRRGGRAGAASRRRRSAQGKTKVILPLFCMAFLSSNKAVRDALARGGREKRCLVVLVPEHTSPDAKR